MDFQKVFDQYHDLFDSWFPTMCFQTDTKEEMVRKMTLCIEKGKPAEEVFNLDYSGDIFY